MRVASALVALAFSEILPIKPPTLSEALFVVPVPAVIEALTALVEYDDAITVLPLLLSILPIKPPTADQAFVLPATSVLTTSPVAKERNTAATLLVESLGLLKLLLVLFWPNKPPTLNGPVATTLDTDDESVMLETLPVTPL